jgi:hypothetical protein
MSHQYEFVQHLVVISIDKSALPSKPLNKYEGLMREEELHVFLRNYIPPHLHQICSEFLQ